ncbi:endonuclease domain-containing protein [Hyphomonas pacifica]|uniref:endonuclease domain-containing protein n=1 Tax=Hyphomonas pacifica TaxID=1280941 RepID=UPI000DD326B0|nr:endonuclease domain-containing protein [Alphaproteobacteria bacterium]
MGGTTKRARQLRRDQTFAERLVWARLRNRQLNGWKFRRQHPIGPYYADFACLDLMLVVELDGDSHGTQADISRDTQRTAFLEAQGWTVVRFWNVEVLDSLDGVLRQIHDAGQFLAARPACPPSHRERRGPSRQRWEVRASPNASTRNVWRRATARASRA